MPDIRVELGCLPFRNDPLAIVQSIGLELAVFDDPLRLPGRIVWGEWDPLLRRIALYGSSSRSDEQLVGTFLHELAHASNPSRSSEAAASGFAETRLAQLGRRDTEQWAGMLRSLSRPLPARTCIYTDPVRFSAPDASRGLASA